MRLFRKRAGKADTERAAAPTMMSSQRPVPPAERRRPRDPLAWFVCMLMLATLALLAVNWALDRATANPDNVIVRGVTRGAGYLLAPWRNIVADQTLGLTTIIAGAAYLLAGILLTALIHWTWNRAVVRRRHGVRTA